VPWGCIGAGFPPKQANRWMCMPLNTITKCPYKMNRHQEDS